MSIPRDFIELLLNRTDIVDLINGHVPMQKKSGSNYFARCPFHHEKSASFSVSQTKQFYHCFGCGAHGNAIDFLMNHDHLSFPEAVETLAKQIGLEVPRTQQTSTKKDDQLPALYELMTEVSQYYYEQMRHSDRVIQYLKKRGISGKIAQQFQLGFAAPGWSHLLDTHGKTEADKKKLLDCGLTIKKDDGGYYDRFRDRVMFPIHDYRGRIIGFGGRIIEQGEPKYLNSPETPLFQKGHELYGLYQALKVNRKLNRALLVEGYMDVIALFQHDITYAVATLGTATTAHHLKRLFRYTSDIIFCFDGDEAGRTAAWRALQVIFPLMHDSLQVRFMFLPEGDDPDSLVRKEGKATFEKRLDTAPSLSDFFFQTMAKQSDMNTLEGRARFAAQSLAHIKTLPTGLFQGLLLDELANRGRVNLADLKAQLKTEGDTQPEQLSPVLVAEPNETKLPAALKMALALLVQYPRLAATLKEPLPTNAQPGVRFMSQLIDKINKSNIATTGLLLEHWRDEKEEPFIKKLAQVEHMIPEAGIENAFLDMIRQIIGIGIDEEINALLAKASQAGLTEAEKATLATKITQKKALTPMIS